MMVPLALALTVGVYLCHRYGPDWDYLFGVAFFGGIPAIEVGLPGYCLGVGFLLFFVGMAYGMERILSGEWQEPAV